MGKEDGLQDVGGRVRRHPAGGNDDGVSMKSADVGREAVGPIGDAPLHPLSDRLGVARARRHHGKAARAVIVGGQSPGHSVDSMNSV
jgi:hypothetical protein